MSRTTHRLVSAGALGVLGLASTLSVLSTAPPPAAAATPSPGSLVFVKDHNVWIARADGSDARPLTADGSSADPWLSPTQADTGEVAAAHAGLIVRMTPTGQVLNAIDPPALTNSLGHPMDGTPAYVAISPNGALIAYSQAKTECPTVASCDTRFATAYTAADHLTDPALYPTTYYDAPQWIGNTRTVQGGGAFREVNLQDVGSPAFHWWRDSEVNPPGKDLSNPAVSRDGQWVATVRGWGSGTSIRWSRVTGDVRAGSAPGLPEWWCETNPEPAASPAWSADSQHLAWTLGSGVWMTAGPADCNQPVLVVPGGSQPSFSAAAYVAASAPAVAPRNTAAPTVSGRARVGRKLTAHVGAWTPAPASYSFRWLRNGQRIRGATHAAYRVRRHDRGRALRVVVTARNPAGTAAATSAPRRIRR